MQEKWENIKGYEGLYQVSNTGKILSLRKNIILKPNKSQKYDMVLLHDANANIKSKLIHRIVAEAYIQNKDNKLQVNHIDGDKRNNEVNNLEWVTQYENSMHAFKIGLMKNNKLTVRAVAQYSMDGKLIKTYNTIKSAGDEMKVDSTNIINVCKGKHKTSCGYLWKYIGSENKVTEYYKQ